MLRVLCAVFLCVQCLGSVAVQSIDEKRRKRGACPPPMSDVKLKDFDGDAKNQNIGKIARNLKIAFGEHADDNCKMESKGLDIKVEDMFAQCKEFCGHGALPIVMGSEDYGMDLEDMNKICLGLENKGPGGIRAGDKDLVALTQCADKAKALDNIEDALVNFLAKWKVMDFGILLLESDILTAIDKIEKKLSSPQFRDSIRRKDRDEKVTFMKRVYKGMLEEKTESTLSMHSVKEDVKNLKTFSDLMWKTIKENLADFKSYIEECNQFYPRVKEQTYLKDLCIQDGGQCMQVSAGCCCGVNPLVPTNAPTAAPTMAPTFAPTFPPTPKPPTPAPPPTPELEPGTPEAEEAEEKKELGGDDDFFDDDAAATSRIRRKLKDQQVAEHMARRLLQQKEEGAAALEEIFPASEDVQRNLKAMPGMCMAGTVGELGDNAQFGIDVKPWNKKLQIKFGEFADNQCHSRTKGREITTTNMFDSCKAFCGEGAVPVVLGTDTFGLNLDQMNDVCLNSKGIHSDANSLRTARSCPDKKQALRDVENSVSDFLASLRVLNYAKLRFTSDIRLKVEQVEQRVKTKKFFDIMTKSDDKPKDLKRLYGKYLGGLKGDPVGDFDLTANAERLAGKAQMMEQMMNKKMQRVIEFFDECDNYYPIDGTNREFLLDMCRVSGSKCLTGDTAHRALHAGCCCGHNPLVKLNSMLSAVKKGGRHLTEALSSPCGKALARSEADVNEMKENTSPKELTREAVNQIEFDGVCARAEAAAAPSVKQYEGRTTHPQVQQALKTLEKKYSGDVPLEPLPEGGCKPDLAETDKKAVCGMFSGGCNSNRKAKCIDGHCQCDTRAGFCSNGKQSGAQCVPNESATHNEKIRCVTDLTETDSSATCSFFFPCKGTRLASCKKGHCTCDGSNICSDRKSSNAACRFQKMPTPFAKPAPPSPAPTPAPCITDLKQTDSSAGCNFFSKCKSSRHALGGCKKSRCTCAAGTCSNMATKGAKCEPRATPKAGRVFNAEGALSADGNNTPASTSTEAAPAAVAVVAAVAFAILAAVAAVVMRHRLQRKEQPVVSAMTPITVQTDAL